MIDTGVVPAVHLTPAGVSPTTHPGHTRVNRSLHDNAMALLVVGHGGLPSSWRSSGCSSLSGSWHQVPAGQPPVRDRRRTRHDGNRRDRGPGRRGSTTRPRSFPTWGWIRAAGSFAPCDSCRRRRWAQTPSPRAERACPAYSGLSEDDNQSYSQLSLSCGRDSSGWSAALNRPAGASRRLASRESCLGGVAVEERPGRVGEDL